VSPLPHDERLEADPSNSRCGINEHLALRTHHNATGEDVGRRCTHPAIPNVAHGRIHAGRSRVRDHTAPRYLDATRVRRCSHSRADDEIASSRRRCNATLHRT